MKLKHPTIQHPDGKIRVLCRETKILYRYLDETKNYIIETNKEVIKYILNGEKWD